MIKGATRVANLSVGDDHTFAVGPDGILVHNVTWCEKAVDAEGGIPDSLRHASERTGIDIHGHHIVMQKGLGRRGQAAVNEFKEILQRAGIENHVEDPRNLTPALNSGYNRSGDYAEAVLRRLRQAEADASASGTDLLDEVRNAFDDIKRDLHRGLDYQYP